MVIGKKGAEIDALRKKLEKVANGPVNIEVVEVKRPELDAALIAQSVAEQLEGRVAFRRAMRKASSPLASRAPRASASSAPAAWAARR